MLDPEEKQLIAEEAVSAPTAEEAPSVLSRLQVACALTTVQQELRPPQGPIQACSTLDALGSKPSPEAKARAASLR
jgi:hypothetical protein